ncbi:MAG: redoxin domain-containing protein [Saprospiraceae bacterium]
MKKIRYVLWAIAIVAIFSIQATLEEEGHAIEFEIKNYADTQMIIAYHFGDKQYISDTLTATKPGHFLLKDKEELDPGMYIAFFPTIGKSFEFLINKGEQHFKLSTDTESFIPSMQVKGSAENTRFFGYLNYLTTKRTERNGMSKLLEQLKKDEATNKSKIEELEGKVKDLDEVVVAYQKGIIDKYPSSFTARIIQINTPIDVPEEVRKDEVKSFYYYKEHFFDNIHLDDDRFLRSPMLHPKIDLYVGDKVTVPHPDSVIIAVDRILKLSEGNEEVFKFALVRLLNLYAKSKIVCMDAVYVHLVDNYYAKGKADWIDEEQLKKIKEDADALRPLLCGRIAPDISMQTLSLPVESKSLHGIKSKYTILFMWDPDCGHCKKSMPDMLKFYDDYKSKGVEVYAICTKTYKGEAECKDFIKEKDMGRWLNMIDPYYRSRYKQIYNVKSTPVVYILDEKKEILAKRIGAEQMSEVMDKIIERDKKLAEEGTKD